MIWVLTFSLFVNLFLFAHTLWIKSYVIEVNTNLKTILPVLKELREQNKIR